MVIEHPKGFLEFRLDLRGEVAAYDEWYETVFKSWKPHYLQSQFGGFVKADSAFATYSYINVKGYRHVENCHVSIVNANNSFSIHLAKRATTPAEPEAVDLLLKSTTVFAKKGGVSANFSFSSSKNFLLCSKPINEGQIRVVLGHPDVEWFLKPRPWRRSEHFHLEETRQGKLICRMPTEKTP